MHGNPLTRGALGDISATQKSAKGSGSAAWTTLRKTMPQNATKASLTSQAEFAIAAAGNRPKIESLKGG
jgi:hypothetical protein